jgi:hypothetical protein
VLSSAEAEDEAERVQIATAPHVTDAVPALATPPPRRCPDRGGGKLVLTHPHATAMAAVVSPSRQGREVIATEAAAQMCGQRTARSPASQEGTEPPM